MPHNGLPHNAMLSTEGPHQMDPSWLQSLASLFQPKPKDIELPAEGPEDPRLMRARVNDMLKSGATALNPLEGLKRALGR